MESIEQRARPIDRKFVGWHAFYTAVLALWTANFMRGAAQRELGGGPAYAFLYLGVIPSLLILVIGLLKPRAAYWAAVIYGAVIALGVVALLSTTPNAMWVIVFFPLFAFILEAAIIWQRRHFCLV